MELTLRQCFAHYVHIYITYFYIMIFACYDSVLYTITVIIFRMCVIVGGVVL